MLVYMECEVKFHSFITWMLESYPPLKTSAALCLGRRYQYLTGGRLGGPWNQTRFDGEQKKILVHIMNQTPVIQYILY
jgi:hypothetical protein